MTTTTLLLTVALAVLVGVSLGLLGGGGSILTVPLLVYVAGLGARESIATSLLVVGVTAAAGVVPHARAGRVRWRTGLQFGGAGVVGAYLGGRLSAFVPEAVLLGGFAAMMLATAVAMLSGRQQVRGLGDGRHPVVAILAEGAAVGLATGIVGAGGGFLVVPALVLLGGLPMPVAVGTSLVVIAMKSAAGLVGYLASVRIDWDLAALVATAAVLGGMLGGRLAGRVEPDRLRRGFGWLVVLAGTSVGAQQLPAGVWERAPGWLWPVAVVALAAVAVAVAVAVVGRRHRRAAAVSDAADRAEETDHTDRVRRIAAPDGLAAARMPPMLVRGPPPTTVEPIGDRPDRSEEIDDPEPIDGGGSTAGPGRSAAAVGAAPRGPAEAAGGRRLRRRVPR
ncbi:MAG: sulfite exporter TauE/SafE family protein [Phycicoccus sp.]